MPIDEERLKALADHFREAEKQIKLAENELGDLLLPPINEIRYSYSHLLKFLVTECDEDDQLRSAEKHIKRSIYDAVDVRVIAYLEMFKAFKEEYKEISIGDVIKDWLEILGRVRQIQEKVSGDNGIDDREERVKEHIKNASELKEICDKCEDARDELSKKFDQSQKSARRWILSLIVALLGILVMIFLA